MIGGIEMSTNPNSRLHSRATALWAAVQEHPLYEDAEIDHCRCRGEHRILVASCLDVPEL